MIWIETIYYRLSGAASISYKLIVPSKASSPQIPNILQTAKDLILISIWHEKTGDGDFDYMKYRDRTEIFTAQ